MTELQRFAWAFSLIIAVAAAILVVGTVATAYAQVPTADPACDPALEGEAASWDVLYEPCAPNWARDVTQVQAVYDAAAQDLGASVRVILGVGFAVLAIPLYALVFLDLGRA